MTSLPLPMGIGVDEANVITEVDAGGAGAAQGLEVGDELLWLDGMEVRDGLVPIVEALDREVVNHLVVLRRVDEIRPADQQPDVGFAQEIGPVELPLPMGMGMNAEHIILELDAEGSAMHDGTLQARPLACACICACTRTCALGTTGERAAPEPRRVMRCCACGAQLGDTLISVDGISLDENTSIVDALDRRKQANLTAPEPLRSSVPS